MRPLTNDLHHSILIVRWESRGRRKILAHSQRKVKQKSVEKNIFFRLTAKPDFYILLIVKRDNPKEDKMRTALVRKENGNLSIIRDDFYNTNQEFAADLRGNGFKVLKVWAKNVSDSEVDEWQFLNRK